MSLSLHRFLCSNTAMNKFDLQDMNVALGNGPMLFEAEERLIIALDFGTTFSGIAYCFPNQGNSKVATVVNWPGSFKLFCLEFLRNELIILHKRPRR